MTAALPWRGPGPDRPDLPLPPGRMPIRRNGRWRKRWRYVGVFGERLMLCAGLVRIGPVPQAFWAIWDRERRALRERTRMRSPRRYVRLPPGRVLIADGGVAVDLEVLAGVPVETASPAGQAWIWTRKQGAVRVRGTVRLDGEVVSVDELGCVDESAGFHARVTEWQWSAGVGALADGRTVGWNLVHGVHDAPVASERTLWVDGAPVELPPVAFAADLAAVSFASGESLAFAPEAVRARCDDLKLFRSDYRQPFGTFTGTFPGGLRLACGRGVMERHAALW